MLGSSGMGLMGYAGGQEGCESCTATDQINTTPEIGLFSLQK